LASHALEKNTRIASGWYKASVHPGAGDGVPASNFSSTSKESLFSPVSITYSPNAFQLQLCPGGITRQLSFGIAGRCHWQEDSLHCRHQGQEDVFCPAGPGEEARNSSSCVIDAADIRQILCLTSHSAQSRRRSRPGRNCPSNSRSCMYVPISCFVIAADSKTSMTCPICVKSLLADRP
jgi:hypothetical protein